MKVHIARGGVVLGEWTQTELYPLLRASEVFRGTIIGMGMTEWKRLAELPSGKSVLATPAQRQLLANHGRFVVRADQSLTGAEPTREAGITRLRG